MLFAYWVHNGSRWVCVGTVRTHAADMIAIVRERPIPHPNPQYGNAAVTRATCYGRSGQMNLPRD